MSVDILAPRRSLIWLPCDDASLNENAKRATRNLSRQSPPRYNVLHMAGAGYGDVGDVSELAFDRTDPWSVSFWGRVSLKTGTGYSTIFAKSDDTYDTGYSAYFSWNMAASPPRCLLAITMVHDYVGGDLVEVVTPVGTRLDDGQWHHHMITADGSGTAAGFSYALDGTPTALTVGTDALTDTTLVSGPFRIGAFYDTSNLVDEIDNLGFWNSELSAAQMLACFNAGRDGDLNDISATVACWPFAASDVYPVAADTSGNGNHATFTGTTADVFEQQNEPGSIALGDGITSATFPDKLNPRGFSFDGTDQYLDLLWTQGGRLDVHAFSVCFLVKAYEPDGDGRLFGMGTANNAYELWYDGTQFTWERNGAAADDVAITGGRVEYGKLKDVVATIDTSGMQLIVDGKLEASFSGDATLSAFLSTSVAYIGLDVSAGAYYRGNIYVASVYPGALTLTQAREWAYRARHYRSVS